MDIGSPREKGYPRDTSLCRNVTAQNGKTRTIGQYEMRDTLSEADLCNYAFALSLAGEKEKALQVVGNHMKDSVMKKQMSEMIGEGGKVIGTMIP